jgi:hypothetical protein
MNGCIGSNRVVIRRVAFGKAVVAGAAGAFAWEVVALLLMWAGAPFSDVSRSLGHLAAPGLPSGVQWIIGLGMHMLIGAIWTVFYAYFFWSTLDISPHLQGLIFATCPAILAGLIMVPQMALMNDHAPAPGIFGINNGWSGPVGIFLNHWIYGIVMGAIYVRPVGYPVSKELRRA